MGGKIRTGSDSDSDGDIDPKIARLSNSDAAAMLAGNWGKKSHYWSGDTADLEIGQDMQDALDEEDAARDLQRQRLKGIRASDYGGVDSGDSDNDGDGDSVGEDEEDVGAKGKGSYGKLSAASLGRAKVSIRVGVFSLPKSNK